ncbi:MAG: hypothetical protein ACI37S_07970 [Candidatus Gastranaerophilaceae bacterium]
MYSGTNIILVTNNEAMVGLLSPELVQLRNIDSILIKNYQDAITAIKKESPQAVLVDCKNSIEEPFCLDLIRRIKEVTSTPIILILENYNAQFVKNAFRFGINEVVNLQYGSSEILMRTIWSLQKRELKQVATRNENLLKELNVINDKTGFYTAKYSKKVFQNEIDYLQTKKQDGIFMAIEPNKISRLSPSLQNIIDTIKNNVRATDIIAHTKFQNTFYILLENTNLEGAMIVWNRINQNIGAQETLCGSIIAINTKTDIENIDIILKDGLIEAQNSPNFVYIGDSKTKPNDNWLNDTNMLNQNNGPKNFKLFKQLYTRKLEKIIKPTIDNLLDEYSEILVNTQTPLIETDDSYSVKFLHKRQESEFSITQDGNNVVINSIHNGLDSPENKTIKMDLSEISTHEIESNFEDFILEFKTCL